RIRRCLPVRDQQGLGFDTLRQRTNADIDSAVDSFEVVLETAAGIVRRNRLLDIIGSPARGRPIPADTADFTGVEKIVQSHESSCQRMMVGSKRFGKLRQRRVAISNLEVTEYLIVGSILFDDIDDMLDPAAEFVHYRIGTATQSVQPIVLNDSLREGFKLGRKWNRQ